VAAENRWHAALLAHPGQTAAVLGLGQALAAQHRFAAARELLSELARRQPSRAEPMVALVRTLIVEGDLQAALPLARELVARDAGRIEHALQLGRVLEAGASMEEAGARYRQLAVAQPQSVEPMLAHAELAARQGDLASARAAFAALLARVPAQIPALLGLAAVCAELGDAEQADHALSQATAIAPNQPQVRLARAACAETLGRLDIARLALLEARSAMPWRVEPLLHLAQLALRQGKLEVAATHGQALLAAHPRNLSARLTAFDTTIAGGVEAARAVLALLADELPEHREVQQRLARLDWMDGSVERARARCARIHAHDPRLRGGPDPIERLDRHPLPSPNGEIRAFLLVRNEAPRLPWLLAYYRRLGVDRFLVLDNGSEDGTRDLLLAQGGDVHLFHTPASFAASAAGMSWTNRLLDAHGSGAWCLTIDADEVLVYPHAEAAALPVLCRYLDGVGAEAMVAPMLDFYAAEPLDRVAYRPGQSLIEAFPWFDADGYVRRDGSDFPYSYVRRDPIAVTGPGHGRREPAFP
jgi:tetratricopeptide (TPR) repeat protein